LLPYWSRPSRKIQTRQVKRPPERLEPKGAKNRKKNPSTLSRKAQISNIANTDYLDYEGKLI
jgi:hypothetical protein